MKTSTILLYLVCLLFIPIIYSSCIYPDEVNYPKATMGWVPVYSKTPTTDDIKMLNPQPLLNPGKIFLRNRYLLLNDRNIGVHVFDNINPSNPVNIGFISIPGNIDVVMRGSILYTDYHNGIASIDLTNPTQPTVLYYLPNTLSISRIKPIANDSNRFNYYQCPDSTKGVVVGWRKDSVYFTQCYSSIR